MIGCKLLMLIFLSGKKEHYGGNKINTKPGFWVRKDRDSKNYGFSVVCTFVATKLRMTENINKTTEKRKKNQNFLLLHYMQCCNDVNINF